MITKPFVLSSFILRFCQKKTFFLLIPLNSLKRPSHLIILSQSDEDSYILFLQFCIPDNLFGVWKHVCLKVAAPFALFLRKKKHIRRSQSLLPSAKFLSVSLRVRNVLGRVFPRCFSFLTQRSVIFSLSGISSHLSFCRPANIDCRTFLNHPVHNHTLFFRVFIFFLDR